LTAFAAAQSACLAFAAPPSEAHADCLRRFVAAALPELRPVELFCSGAERDAKRAAKRAAKERRRTERATRNAVIRSYGFVPILAFLIPEAIAALINWAFEMFFSWLWEKATRTPAEFSALCPATP
jgi:hypothetical protein